MPLEFGVRVEGKDPVRVASSGDVCRTCLDGLPDGIKQRLLLLLSPYVPCCFLKGLSYICNNSTSAVISESKFAALALANSR